MLRTLIVSTIRRTRRVRLGAPASRRQGGPKARTLPGPPIRRRRPVRASRPAGGTPALPGTGGKTQPSTSGLSRISRVSCSCLPAKIIPVRKGPVRLGAPASRRQGGPKARTLPGPPIRRRRPVRASRPAGGTPALPGTGGKMQPSINGLSRISRVAFEAHRSITASGVSRNRSSTTRDNRSRKNAPSTGMAMLRIPIVSATKQGKPQTFGTRSG